MKFNVILVKFGEIGIKGKIARRRMQTILAKNIETALKENGFMDAKVKVHPGRIIVDGISEDGREAEVISRVFGVTGVSRAHRGEYSDLRDLVSKVANIVEEDVKGKIFMVRGRRAYEERFNSKDIERELGSELLRRGAKKVDLENPEVSIWTEARGGIFLVYAENIRGPGGLPLGTDGKVIALVSGGFDSPVAAWMIMRRGAKADIVFFNIGGKLQKEVFLKTVRKLLCNWGYGYNSKVFIIEHRWIFPYLDKFPEGFRTVALKASMYMGGEIIAEREKAKAIVTGESLAQVSSQTLDNLFATEQFVSIPVLRPLIGMDKVEIIDLARKIGTYEHSSMMPEFCAISGTKASTSVDPKRLSEIYEELRLRDEIKGEVINNAEIIERSELCMQGP